ncbi:MAG: response regulator [Planctomycetales bacterium]
MVARKTRYELLIADDDPGFRRTLCSVLEPHYQTVEVSSGEEAIQIVQRRPVDAVLLDMHMQLMTGLEALRILRTVQQLLPCILITADADEQLRREAAKAEAFRVLKKPVGKNELLETVSIALETSFGAA